MKKGVMMIVVLFVAIGLLASLSYAQEAEKAVINTISERIEITGELETGFWVDSMGRRGISGRTEDTEFQLTTAALAVDAKVTDWIDVTVVPMFEVEEFFVDEGHVTIGPTDTIPVYFTAGLLYFPFGKREEYTHFPDEPLVNLPATLYLGEIWDPGFVAGITKEIPFAGLSHKITIEAFGVYPKVTDSSGNRQLDNFGFNVCYNLSGDEYKFEIGGSYINNVLNSRGIKDFFADQEIMEIAGVGVLTGPLTHRGFEYKRFDGPAWDGKIRTERDVDAVAAYMSAEYKNFYLTAEYMGVTEPIRSFYWEGSNVPLVTLTDSEGKSLHPHVWGVEIGAGLEDYLTLPVPVEAMFRYEGSIEAQPIYGIPRNRWAIGLNVGIYKYATWSLAYAYSDYDPDYTQYNDNRTNRNLFFSQIAIKF